MNGNERSQHAEQSNEGVRDIPKWARKYAENRTAPLLAYLLVATVGVVAVLLLADRVQRSLASGDRMAAALWIVLLSAAVTWMLWFRFAGCVGFMRRVSDRFYRAEGSASAGPQELTPRERAISCATYALFGFCFLATFGLTMAGLVSARYFQPVTALFVVPFFVHSFARRGAKTSFMMLWPALYGVHAILIVAGVPIWFEGKSGGMNVALPIIGYGVLASVVGHLYSRVALWRLKMLASGADMPADGEGE